VTPSVRTYCVRVSNAVPATAEVTDTLKFVLCVSEDDVPVNVALAVPAGVAGKLDRVIVTGVPGVSETLAGEAIRPDGKPLI
jgi:hypothetical protein